MWSPHPLFARAGAAMLAIAVGPRATDPAGGILEFHPVVMAALAAPPEASTLRVVCTQKVRATESNVGVDGWWSLLAPSGEAVAPSAVIALFTRDKVKKPADVMTTTVRYGPMPTAKVTRRASLDWAWVWDRNGDGRVDYAAYLQNAHSVLPDPVPADWPRPQISADGTVSVTMKLLEAVIDHSAMVFRHYADDDFDGTADAVVVEQFDATFPMFVGNYVVARRTPGAARAGEAWAFRRAITDTLRLLTPDSTGTIRIPSIVSAPGAPPIAPGAGPAVGPGTESADERLGYGTRFFEGVNAVVARCGADGGRIRRP